MNWILWPSIVGSLCLRQFKIVPKDSLGAKVPIIFTEIFQLDSSIFRITKNTLSEPFDISWNFQSSALLLSVSFREMAFKSPLYCQLFSLRKGQVMRQKGLQIRRSVATDAVVVTAFNVVFPVQQTALAPNEVTSFAVLKPNMATSERAETVTSDPPMNAAGVTTLKSRTAMERTSSLLRNGGRKGTISSIRVSTAMVPYFII